MYTELIQKIKEKKSLHNLEDHYVQEEINKFLKQNQKLKNKLKEKTLKKKDKEQIIKEVRNILNIVYGQFWIGEKLELDSHKSTKERIEDYNEIYQKIFSITGKPKTILDLGAGLNILTYKDYPEIHFIATELTKIDCEKIKEYYKNNKINAEIIQTDLRTHLEFPKADLCFMFKILDTIEKKGHKLAEELIQKIKAKYIVVSFSTITVHNQKMNYPKRGWIEQLTKRLEYETEKFETRNEIFYIIKKN